MDVGISFFGSIDECLCAVFSAHSALRPVDDGVVLDHPVPVLAGCDGWVASAHHRRTGDLIGRDEAVVDGNRREPQAGADVATEEEDTNKFDEPERVWRSGSDQRGCEAQNMSNLPFAQLPISSWRRPAMRIMRTKRRILIIRNTLTTCAELKFVIEQNIRSQGKLETKSKTIQVFK